MILGDQERQLIQGHSVSKCFIGAGAYIAQVLVEKAR